MAAHGSVDSQMRRKGRYVVIRGGSARRERRRALEVSGARRASLPTAGGVGASRHASRVEGRAA